MPQLRIVPLCCLYLFGFCACAVHAQTDGPTPAAKGKKSALSIKPDGPSLSAVTDVSSSVSVDGVLLPPDVARRIFGREVSKHYAVVQMTISNHSATASFVLQSAKLDYSHWLFSGSFGADSLQPGSVTHETFESSDKANQVASAESRLVRGQLLDAQKNTPRNWILRTAVLLGASAAGFQYLTADADVLAGIGAFNGQVIPALGAFLPDNSQAQIDRISDYGFRTNHSIPKQSADIVVAFFPIDRFVDSYFKKLFMNHTADFFAPGQMLADPKQRQMLVNILSNYGVDAASGSISTALMDEESLVASQKDLALANARPAGAADRDQQIADAAAKVKAAANALTSTDKKILYILDHASLNNIRLLVGGEMQVNTNLVPATIDSVTFDAAASADGNWAAGTFQMTVRGTFLDGAVPSFVDADKLGISAVAALPESTDTKLVLSYTLAAPISPGKPLNLVLTKSDKSGTVTVSAPFAVSPVAGLPSIAGDPTVTSEATATAAAWAAGAHTATVAGAHLAGISSAILNGPPNGSTAIKIDPTKSDDSKVTFSYTLGKAVPSGTALTLILLYNSTPDTPSAVSRSFNVTYPAQ